MKINVAQVKQSIGAGQSFHFHIPIAGLDREELLPWLSGEIEVSGEATNTGRVIAVKGVIKATANHECNRCLNEYSAIVEIPFAENYLEQGTSNIDDPDLVVFEGDEIDITNTLRDTLVMSEPLKPLCSESCRGLCLICGADLNTGECGCDRIIIDPRMAALQKLLEKK